MPGERVLLIGSDRSLPGSARAEMEKLGWEVLVALTADEAMKVAAEGVAIILVDFGNKAAERVKACEMLKREARSADVPVLLIAGAGQDEKIIAGLEAGAEGHLTRPFSAELLLTVMLTTIRRNNGRAGETPLVAGELTVNTATHRVSMNGETIALTPTEFRLLAALLRHGERVLTRPELLKMAVGQDAEFVVERTVDVHLAALRKKLKVAGQRIETVRGVGYRFRR